jgi:uncharacterized membrane protein
MAESAHIRAEKPVVELIGADGNVFALLSRCTRALRRVGRHQSADELTDRVKGCGSYDEALQIMMEYVEAS